METTILRVLLRTEIPNPIRWPPILKTLCKQSNSNKYKLAHQSLTSTFVNLVAYLLGDGFFHFLWCFVISTSQWSTSKPLATLVVSSFMPSVELWSWTCPLTWSLDLHWPYTHTLSWHVICFLGFNNPQLGLCISIHL